MDITREKDRGGFFLPADLSFLKREVLLRTTSHKTNLVTGRSWEAAGLSTCGGHPARTPAGQICCGVTKGWAGPCHKPSHTPVPSPGTLAAALMM